MKPNTMEKRAVRLRDLYAQAEEHLLRKLGNRFKDVMSATDAPLWYRIKMSEIFQVQTELELALSELEAASLEMRTALTEAAFALGIDEADKDFNSILSQQGADGIFTALGIDGPTGRSQAITALMDDSEMRFSELHRRILRDTEDAYREVLAESLPFVTMGVETYQDAVKRALQGFAERGITGFVDKAGRHWGMAEYAEMATRTGLANAQIAGYTQECLRYGYDLVIVSDHSDTCPLCGKWERKILSLTGEKADDPECAGTISEARRAGLFHPNCGHRFVAYIPGQTDKGLSRGHDKEQDATGYKNRQLQRYYERQVRKWKRIQAAALTPEDEREAQFHVKQWQKKLRAHTAAANLPRKYEREGGRVLLSEEAKKIKPLKYNKKGDIIRTADSLTWLADGYSKAVDDGELSSLTGFSHYVEVAKDIQNRIVGITTSDGEEVFGFSTHFIDRIIGCYSKKREPVSIDDVIKALKTCDPSGFRNSKDGKSVSCIYCLTDICSVSFNRTTGMLIQVSPKAKVK